MRSIAIINQKGGVGKTTTAVNVAAALAADGHRVLLIDLDPQAHATLHLGIEPGDNDGSVYELMIGGGQVTDVARPINEHLWLIPATIDLVEAEITLAARPRRDTVLVQALQPHRDAFDYCLIDCAPSLGLLTINALAAVQEVLIPLQPHFLALQGLGRLLQTISLVRGQVNRSLRVRGIILCMFEAATRLAQEIRADVERFLAAAQPTEPWHGARVFQTVIRRNIKLAECPSFGRTIFDYAPTSHGAEDYRALAREIAELAPAASECGTPVAVLPSDGLPEDPPAAAQRLGTPSAEGIVTP